MDATPGAPRKRALFISSYDIPCGIANFTEGLMSHLRHRFDVEVAALDQYVLRSTVPVLERAGDKLIADIATFAKAFDVVNLQWEAGLLGLLPGQIVRRLQAILASHRNMVVTAHSVVATPPRRLVEGVAALARGRVRTAMKQLQAEDYRFGRDVNTILRRAAKNPDFRLIVHTRREARYFREAIGIPHVYDHPLSMMREGWDDRLPPVGQVARERLQKRFGCEKKFIGFFGFLGSHKGIVTAIEAMRYLPKGYMLLLFGGVHPQMIKEAERTNEAIRDIIEAVEGKRPRQSLFDQVQFMGSLNDFEFAAAMVACDVNIFPYLEVGQSASAPASLSIELGRPTVVSNNHMFMELDRYMPGAMQFFDIGNYLQLAQKIREATEGEPSCGTVSYNAATQAELYARVFERRGVVMPQEASRQPLAVTLGS